MGCSELSVRMEWIRRRASVGANGRHGNVVPTYRPKDDDAASSLPEADDVLGREGITIPSVGRVRRCGDVRYGKGY